MHHVQVVGDENVSQVQPRLDFGQQVEHLGLDRFVQGGDGLVQDEQARIDGDAAGDIDPLALTAGHLVRVTVREQIWVETDEAQNVAGFVAGFRGWHAAHAQAECDLGDGGVTGVKRRVAVL